MKEMETSTPSHTTNLTRESTRTPIPALQQTNGTKGAKTGKSLQIPVVAMFTQHAVGDAPIQSQETARPLPRKRKTKREAITLSQADVNMLKTLKQRCEAVGMKVRKTQLLVAGLHLLSSMPMGKFLAVLGPLETQNGLPQIRRRKATTRVNEEHPKQ